MGLFPTAAPLVSPVAAILLAAGTASRMGTLKQLLPYRGGTLLQHAVREAQTAGFEQIVVVLGAEAHPVRDSLAGFPVEFAINDLWSSGMGSSIAAGMSHLERIGKSPQRVAILLGDQPLVSAHHLIAMRELGDRAGVVAVAAEYGGRLGVPAFFAADLFPALRALNPAAGASQLLNRARIAVVPFPLPEAAFDIDTPADFKALSEAGN